MADTEDDDQGRARALAKKNIRLAVILGLIALSIFVGYIIHYY